MEVDECGGALTLGVHKFQRSLPRINADVRAGEGNGLEGVSEHMQSFQIINHNRILDI